MIFQIYDMPSGYSVIFSLSPIVMIVLFVLFIVIGLLLVTLFLKIALNLVKSKNNDFNDVFVTAIICVLLGWIPCLGCILCGLVIGARHDTGFLVGLLVYILAILIGLIISILISIALVSVIYGVSIVLW
ncbi:MAG: hypothetical protein ACP6IY_03725 [Promethearchaeia archaeon]